MEKETKKLEAPLAKAEAGKGKPAVPKESAAPAAAVNPTAAGPSAAAEGMTPESDLQIEGIIEGPGKLFDRLKSEAPDAAQLVYLNPGNLAKGGWCTTLAAPDDGEGKSASKSTSKRKELSTLWVSLAKTSPF